MAKARRDRFWEMCPVFRVTCIQTYAIAIQAKLVLLATIFDTVVFRERRERPFKQVTQITCLAMLDGNFKRTKAVLEGLRMSEAKESAGERCREW